MNKDKKTKLFGTDGIRGAAGKFPLDSQTVRVIGASLAQHLSERHGRVPKIVIGRDTRESGPSICRALTAGALSAGAEVRSAAVITTPGVAFLARTLPADAGVVISASHNPYHDNGIKIFDPSGRKLDDVTERQIESDIAEHRFEEMDSAEISDEDEHAALRDLYFEYLKNEVARGLQLSGLKIVIDCANGAAYEIAPELFRSLDAQLVTINDQPDGRNINLNCGSLHIENLQKCVIAEHADLGVAFDGDADRALFVNAKGEFVDGDATMWVLANYLKSRNQLADDLVIATVMTNLGLEVALRSRGIKLTRTDVGDKYVLDELLRSRASLGGEQSGHIIFPRISLAGDGLITAFSLIRVMQEEGKSVAQLVDGFTRYPQILLNVPVREKVPFENLDSVSKIAREAEKSLGDRGRLLLRYSGTEALARVMIEGEDEHQVTAHARALAEAIRSEIGTETATT